MMNALPQWNQSEVEPPPFPDLDLVTKIWKTQAETTTGDLDLNKQIFKNRSSRFLH